MNGEPTNSTLNWKVDGDKNGLHKNSNKSIGYFRRSIGYIFFSSSELFENFKVLYGLESLRIKKGIRRSLQTCGKKIE